MSDDGAALDFDDLETALFGFEVDEDTASLEARLAIFTGEVLAAGSLVANGNVATARATESLQSRATELRLADSGLDIEAVVVAYFAAAKSTVRMPPCDLNDPSSWEAWAASWLPATASDPGGKVRDIRPGARGSGSFVSMLMTQRSLVRLAELCPAGAPWQSLVLAVQELEQVPALAAELDNARLKIRQLQARLAELRLVAFVERRE